MTTNFFCFFCGKFPASGFGLRCSNTPAQGVFRCVLQYDTAAQKGKGGIRKQSELPANPFGRAKNLILKWQQENRPANKNKRTEIRILLKNQCKINNRNLHQKAAFQFEDILYINNVLVTGGVVLHRFETLYQRDLGRYTPGEVTGWTRLFHYFLRKTQTSGSRLKKTWYHFWFRFISDRHRMEISSGTKIGKGLCLPRPYTITINSNAILGENVTLGKNVTIGKQNRGERAGTPIIGNRVSIGDNAVIVGKITIGDDVLIASNTYINRDVPAGTSASGNPYKG